MSLHKNLVDDDIHALPARTYADITARDADTDFHVTANIDKMVRVDSPVSYFILVSIGPVVWISSDAEGADEFIELTDTPSTYTGQAGLPLQVNSGETAVEFTDSLTLVDLTLTNDLMAGGMIIGDGTNGLLDLRGEQGGNIGGNVSIQGGFGLVTPGKVNIIAGSTNAIGEDVTISGGDGPTGQSGGVNLLGGTSGDDDGIGGDIFLRGGQGGVVTGAGGDVTIQSGDSEGELPGTLTLKGGEQIGFGVFGNIIMQENGGSVGIGTSTPATDSSLDLGATDKAFMNNGGTTVERDALTPSKRMWWYNTDTDDQEFYNGTAWQSTGGGDVVGPAGAVDNGITTYNGVSGKSIQSPTGITYDGLNLDLLDDIPIRFGNDNDFVIEHGGVDSEISNNTGDLIITNWNDTGAVIVNLGTETNATKFQVNDSAGNNLLKILGNGNIAFSNDDFIYVSGSMFRLDHLPINWGVNPVDLAMQHGGSNGFITNTTGDFTITNEQTTGDIVSKIGSTNTNTNFIWQDSAASELMRLTGAGQLGINESAPDNNIHLNGGSIQIGAKNNVLDNRLILSSGGDIKMTRGLNDGSETSVHGRWQIINNVSGILNVSSDSGGIFFRQNSGDWGAVAGGSSGTLEFYTGGTSTNQTYDNMSSTLAMSINDSQEVTMAGDLALDGDIIHQNISVSGSQSEIFLDDTGLVEQFRIRHDDSSFGKIFFTGRAQVTHESTNGVAWNWTMTNGDDTIPFFEWNQDGTNGADIQVHLTDRDPINITANSGSLAIRADGVDSALYVNHAAVNGNQWEALAFDSKLSRASFSTSTDTATLGLVGLYACTDTSAERTLTISKTSIIQGSLTHAFEFTIKDESGGAGTNHITIETESTAVLFCEAGGGGTVFTTSGSDNLEVGSIVVHTGFTDDTYNGTFTVTSNVSGTSYGIAAITFNATSTGTMNPTIDGIVSVQIIADYGDITLYSNGTNLLTVGI